MKGIHEAGKTLGFIPNRAHANWYIEIGEMTIMGCQAMYIVECETVVSGNVVDWVTEEGNGIKEFDRPSAIYIVN